MAGKPLPKSKALSVTTFFRQSRSGRARTEKAAKVAGMAHSAWLRKVVEEAAANAS